MSQRRLCDNAISMMDVYKAQVDATSTLDSVRVRQLALEGKVSHLEGKLNIIYEKLCSIASSSPSTVGSPSVCISALHRCSV